MLQTTELSSHMKIALLIVILCFPIFARADWAVAPKLESSIFWELVAKEKAEVVSSVGFGSPEARHSKHTVFRIKKLENTDKIEWVKNSDGSYKPVMCAESWDNWLTYKGSICYIPGCISDNDKCISKITENL